MGDEETEPEQLNDPLDLTASNRWSWPVSLGEAGFLCHLCHYNLERNLANLETRVLFKSTTWPQLDRCSLNNVDKSLWNLADLLFWTGRLTDGAAPNILSRLSRRKGNARFCCVIQGSRMGQYDRRGDKTTGGG